MNRIPRSIHPLLVVLALSLPSSFVHAQLVQENVYAGPVFKTWITLAPNELVHIETSNLSAGADTVLHLWDRDNLVEAAFNDDTAGSLRSVIDFTNTSGTTRTYMLLLRAYHSSTHGTADLLWIANSSWAQHLGATVGGTFVTVPTGHQYQTVLLRNGMSPALGAAPDTELFGFNPFSRLVAHDDDSGVGLASMLTPNANITKLLVAPYWPDQAGNTHVYANDQTDPDGDGLGTALENALGTCASSCSNVVQPQDTDRDGIQDYYEVFGYDVDGDALYFPSWGADPLHKDIFIESDYNVVTHATNPLGPEEAVAIAGFMSTGSAADLQNPDGQPGVSIHIDNGVDAPFGETRWGNFGGATEMWSERNCYERDVLQSAARQKYFRLAIGYVGGSGQAQQASCFVWGTDTGPGPLHQGLRTFVHELGHTLGLHHHGMEVWGAMNCKPHYRSVMNYAYEFDPGSSFSNGAMSSIVLNPASVTETVGIGGPVGILGAAPFAFSTSGNSIDFDRDFTYQSVPQRAGFTHLNYGCESHGLNAQALKMGTKGVKDANGNVTTATVMPTAATTPALVKLGSRLYAFWVGTDNRLRYRQGAVSSPANGSCPGGATLGAQCTTWADEQTVNTSSNVAGFSATAMSGKLVLAYRATGTNLIHIKSSNTIDAAGNVSSWSADASRGVSTTVEPELDLFTINTGLFATPTQVLALFYRSATNNDFRWHTATSPTGTWTDRGQMRDSSNAVMTGALSPTVAARGSGTGAEYCGVFPDTTNGITVYCFDRASSRWRSIVFLGRSNSKIGFAFHTRRRADGSPLAAARDGQWYMSYVEQPPGDPAPRMRISGGIAAANNTGLLTFTNVQAVNPWDRQLAGAGIHLYEDETIGAMKALRVWTVDEYAFDPRLEFLPLADGTPSVALKDGNDWRVMGRTVCENLRGSAFCGAANPATGY